MAIALINILTISAATLAAIKLLIKEEHKKVNR
jgi:hypothetical protein